MRYSPSLDDDVGLCKQEPPEEQGASNEEDMNALAKANNWYVKQQKAQRFKQLRDAMPRAGRCSNARLRLLAVVERKLFVLSELCSHDELSLPVSDVAPVLEPMLQHWAKLPMYAHSSRLGHGNSSFLWLYHSHFHIVPGRIMIAAKAWQLFI